MSQNGENGEHFKHQADVSAQRIARVYAESLLNAAQERNEADTVFDQLDSLVTDLFKADPALEAFLASGAFSRLQKASLIQSVFEKRASELFFNFLMVLNQHDRLDLIRVIRDAYRDFLDQRARRMRVRVRSAVPLSGEETTRLNQELRDTLHLEPVLDTEIDPDLIGGLVVQVGDWVYDGSVRTRLETLRNQLIARSSHEIQTRRDSFSIAGGN
jgi:F-type H+-transporting ATPase subunit delta